VVYFKLGVSNTEVPVLGFEVLSSADMSDSELCFRL